MARRADITVDVQNLDAVKAAMQELIAERDAYRAVVDAARAYRTLHMGPCSEHRCGQLTCALVAAVDALPPDGPGNGPESAVEARVDVIGPDGHVYWSTHCRHDHHDACKAGEFAPGVPRRPAECKTCAAPCVCACHVGEDAGDGLNAPRRHRHAPTVPANRVRQRLSRAGLRVRGGRRWMTSSPN